MRSSVLVLCALAFGVAVMPGRARAAPQPASPQIEGRITIGRLINGGPYGSNAHAVFARSSPWGNPVASDGPCTLYSRDVAEGLSAGTITISGTAAPIVLEARPTGRAVVYRHSTPVPNPPFTDGATIEVEASGGADVPAFTASVNAPPELTGYVPPASLSRHGYTATWTPNAGTEIVIVIGAMNLQTKDGALVVCRVPDTGKFTVPASTFALIPQAFDHAVVFVGRVGETIQTAGDAHIAIDAMSSIGAGPFPLGPTERDRDAAPVASVAATRSPVRCETSPRFFFSVGFGSGGVSRNGDVPPTGYRGWRLQLGQRLRHGLHLVEELNWLGEDYISPYPTETTERHISMGAGVRWTPFEPAPQTIGSGRRLPIPYLDFHAFYLTAVIGANLRDRVTQTSPTQSTERTAWSPMASLAVGLLELNARDWSLGPEFREQLAYYDGHLQRGWMLLIAIHLDTW